MKPGKCSVSRCQRGVWRRGLCSLHYRRLREHGSTDDPRPTLHARFWSMVDRGGPDDCWLWTGGVTAGGYAQFNVARSKAPGGHRWIYEQVFGRIPDGCEIDHTCHNRDASCPGGVCRHRRCVNPFHLEAVDSRSNKLRGRGPSAINAAKTLCDQGHPFDEENTYLWGGSRYCKTCRREQLRAWRAGQRRAS